MTIRLKPYDSAEYLKDDEAVLAYLQEVLDAGDPDLIPHALGVVARARGMSQIAKEAGLARESLYRALSDDGNPGFGTVMKVLRAMGMNLSVTRREHSDEHVMA